MAIGAKKITLPITNESTGTVSNVEYSFVQTDNTLAVSGAAADAKKTGDEITELKQDYNSLSESKADKNNDNPEMGAGYAGQLVSSLRKSDSVPYNFRKVPYDSTLEDGSIVGASVAWNQLIQNGDFSNGTTGWAKQNSDWSVSNNVLTFTPTASAGNVYQSMRILAHKYFVMVSIKLSASPSNIDAIQIDMRFGSGATVITKPIDTTNWQTLVGIGSGTAYDGGYLRLIDFNSSNWVTIQVKNWMCFDLTQMLGTTIADYIYSLETATAGSGVAWLKEHFPKQFGGGYQAYNAGEIKSISGLSEHKSVGFNAWDEEWEVGSITDTGSNYASNANVRSKNFTPVIPGNVYFVSAQGSYPFYVFFYDVNKTFVRKQQRQTNGTADASFTPNDNEAFIRFYVGSSYGTTYNHDICINISKTTGTPKNGDYVAYEEHTYALDSTKTLRGILKLDSNNHLYADGDVYKADGTVERTWGEVDLGSLDWESLSSPSSHIFRAPLVDAKPSSTTQSAQNDPANAMMSNGYEAKGFTPISASDDKHFAIGFAQGLDTMRLVVIDLSQSSTSSFKTAMTGVHLVYEKMTATTETALPYGNPQVIDPDGTESYVYTDGAFELPVGHESEYPVNVSGQLDDILDTPTTNGTYTLQATVTDGAVSYEWVSTT